MSDGLKRPRVPPFQPRVDGPLDGATRPTPPAYGGLAPEIWEKLTPEQRIAFANELDWLARNGGGVAQ